MVQLDIVLPPDMPLRAAHDIGEALQRDIERLGVQKARQSGSHVPMKRESKACVVLMHGEVKIGTLAGLLRQADVTPEDFMVALRK